VYWIPGLGAINCTRRLLPTKSALAARGSEPTSDSYLPSRWTLRRPLLRQLAIAIWRMSRCVRSGHFTLNRARFLLSPADPGGNARIFSILNRLTRPREAFCCFDSAKLLTSEEVSRSKEFTATCALLIFRKNAKDGALSGTSLDSTC